MVAEREHEPRAGMTALQGDEFENVQSHLALLAAFHRADMRERFSEDTEVGAHSFDFDPGAAREVDAPGLEQSSQLFADGVEDHGLGLALYRGVAGMGHGSTLPCHRRCRAPVVRSGDQRTRHAKCAAPSDDRIRPRAAVEPAIDSLGSSDSSRPKASTLCCSGRLGARGINHFGATARRRNQEAVYGDLARVLSSVRRQDPIGDGRLR